MKVKLQRVWIQATADKRKFGLLCAVAAVGLLLWGRLILTSNVPRTVVAEPSAESVSGTSDIADLRSQRTKPTQMIELWSTPGRDPFVISPLYFPPPSLGVNTGEVGKSGDESAENHERTAS